MGGRRPRLPRRLIKMVIRKRIKTETPALVFVTTTVYEWLPIFRIPKAAQEALYQLQETSNKFNASIPGYVLMPSHLHLLVGLRRLDSLSCFMQNLKSLSARKISKLHLGQFRKRLESNSKFRIWKPRFDDVIITSEKQFGVKLEYIHNNPVKAGLVDRQEDYIYSSAGQWLNDERGIINIDKEYSWI